MAVISAYLIIITYKYTIKNNIRTVYCSKFGCFGSSNLIQICEDRTKNTSIEV